MGALKVVASSVFQRGSLMIEVLVTIAIIAIGLTGLVQMQARLQKSEVEAYQRTQAVMLVNDMASRLSTNRLFVDDYVTGGALGVNAACDDPDDSGLSLQEIDFAEWCAALRGAGEVQAGSSVGAMTGGRGCVQLVDGTQYMVTVVWQGMTPISAPPEEVTCGASLYDLPADSACADVDQTDKCRRYVTTVVNVGNLAP